MRCVRLDQGYHVLDGTCSHNALMYAMQTLLAGYVCVDEGVEGGHSTQYYRLLREAVQELQEVVKQHAGAPISLSANAGGGRVK